MFPLLWHATRGARVVDLRVPTALAMQANINFLDSICASRWHQRCQWVNGDFGRSPFFGQLSGKPLLASTGPCIGTEIKAQGCVENLIRG
jgi:hypothetical protein